MINIEINKLRRNEIAKPELAGNLSPKTSDSMIEYVSKIREGWEERIEKQILIRIYNKYET